MQSGANASNTFRAIRETLLSYPLHDKQPAHAMKLTEKTAPPAGYVKNVIHSLRQQGLPTGGGRIDPDPHVDGKLAAGVNPSWYEIRT